jgi:hypothetical protein
MEVSSKLHASIDLPSGKNHGTHWVRIWLGLEIQSGRFEEQMNIFPCQDSNPGLFTSSCSLIADHAVPAPGEFSSLAPVLSSIFFFAARLLEIQGLQ